MAQGMGRGGPPRAGGRARPRMPMNRFAAAPLQGASSSE
jgi:hypothetical protein